PDPTWRGVTPSCRPTCKPHSHAERHRSAILASVARAGQDRARRIPDAAWIGASPPGGQAPPPGVRPRLAGSDPVRLREGGFDLRVQDSVVLFGRVGSFLAYSYVEVDVGRCDRDVGHEHRV